MTSLEAIIQEGRQAVEKQDDALISNVTDRLEKEAHRVTSAMYQGANATSAENASTPKPGAGTGDRGRKDVVDAEFEDTQQGHP